MQQLRMHERLEEIGEGAVGPRAVEAWAQDDMRTPGHDERACALGQGPELTLADLPSELRDNGAAPSRAEALADAGGTFQQMKARRIAAMEKTYVEELLAKHRGNVTHCSDEAGMARSAFQKLMQKHGIRSADFRD